VLRADRPRLEQVADGLLPQLLHDFHTDRPYRVITTAATRAANATRYTMKMPVVWRRR
jgi:hypothetical protein